MIGPLTNRNTKSHSIFRLATGFANAAFTDWRMIVSSAIPIVSTGRADVLALPVAWQFGQWLGLLALAVLALLLYRTATSAEVGSPETSAIG